MVEYKIVSRGEGLAAWIGKGHFCPTYFTNLLDKTPEPLLDEPALDELLDFLRDPTPLHRWTKARKLKGIEFAALVRASESDALVPSAKDLLCQYLGGRSLLKRGRPPKIGPARFDLPLMARFIKDHVEVCLREGAPLIIPKVGEVFELEEWQALPLSDRAMHIAHKALHDRGFDPPSVRTLRNRLPRHSTLGIFS